MSPAITGSVASSAFVRSWSIIGWGSSLQGTATPRSASGTATRAGSDGELQRRSVASEFGEAVHRGPQDLGREHAGARGVVAPGGVGVPDLLMPHAVNAQRNGTRRGWHPQ